MPLAEAERAAAPAQDSTTHALELRHAVPFLLAASLLGLGYAFDGLFLVRHWAPVAILVLVVVGALGVRTLPVALRPGIALAWALPVFAALSALWATLPGHALEGAGRTAFYVGLLTVPVICLTNRRAARLTAMALTAGVGLSTFVVLALLTRADPTSLMLAGRLNEPVGYRNGTAALFAFAAVVLVCVAASRAVPVAGRGVAFGGAVIGLGLAYMTQSRGVLLAAVAGVAVACLLGPDRLRRVYLASTAAAFVAAISSRLLEPYDVFLEDRITDADAVSRAANALAVAGIVSVVVMIAIAVLDRGLRGTEVARTARRAGIAILGVGAFVGAVGAVAVVGNPVSFAERKLDEFTTIEGSGTSAGASRLGSVSGQRYDVWRVAWREFADNPIGGIGEGSYRTSYYQLRKTDRNLTSAHSLPLGIAAELGLVGIALALAAFIALLVPLLRAWRGVPEKDQRWASILLAAAAVVLAQSAVDWIWTIPLLAGLTLLCVGTALALVVPRGPARPLSRVVDSVAAAGAAVVVLIIGSIYIGTAYVREAREARLEGDAVAQHEAARDADGLLRWRSEPKHLAAGALEALGRVDEARAELRAAIDLEPESFVSYALLGDLEFRAGDLRAARRWYGEALERNPLDVGLQRLATG